MFDSSLNRAFKTFAFITLFLALAAPQANAATVKKAADKKQQVTKSASANVANASRSSSSATGPKSALSASVVKTSKVSRTSKVFVTSPKNVRVVTSIKRKPAIVIAAPPPRLSFGQIAGLHGAQDELALKSSVALVIDQDTREVLFSKNQNAVLPIASITKLMTGVIVTGAKLPMDEMITVTQDDIDTEKGSR